MKFKRLKLSGFKSFVEPTDMQILKGLTGVVGPNGCGKSNLLEAIRWAMGEGSPKSLRGGGMDDVIFAGTETRPARDFAEVSLLIERTAEEAGESAAGEAEITRRIERGAGSAYRINGDDVRAKDVALLFADAATGAHSPALVSQGKIGAVIAAKPQQRRQLLEEAAGISGLHQRRRDAEQKLRAAETNLEKVDAQIGEQAARAAALKRQAKAAARYRELSDEIRVIEAQALFVAWRDADAAATRAETEAREAGEKVKALDSEREAAAQAQAEAGTALSTAREAAIAARARGQEMAHQLATLRAEEGAATRRIAELDAAMNALAGDRAREEALQADAARALEALEAEREALEARLAHEEEEAEAIYTRLHAAEEAARDAETDLSTLLAKEAAGKAERRVAAAALDSAAAQAGRVENELRRLAEQEAALDGLDDLRNALAAAERDGAAQEKRLTAAAAEIETAIAARDAALAKRDGAEQERAARQAMLATLEADIAALERALDDDRVGMLDGIGADPGYERALAAALGEDLKAEIGGDGPRRWQPGDGGEAGDAPLPGGAEALADHVRAPDALHRRLAMIAVVERDEGQQLAPGQRLVTRDGLMRRWDGFVRTGDGEGAAQQLERANRLSALTERLPDARDAAQAATDAAEKLARSIAAGREREAEARARLADAEDKRRAAQREVDRTSAAIERHQERAAALKERREELKPLSDSAAARLAEAQRELAAMPDDDFLMGEVARARSAATEAGEAVAELRATVATHQQAIRAARERHGAAGREQAEWRTRGRDAERRLEETGHRAEAQREEREQLADRPAALREKIESVETEARSGEQERATALSREEEAQAALDKAQAVLAERTERVSAMRERRATATARAEAAGERRAERVRQTAETYETIPQRLPERVGFDEDDLPDADDLRTHLNDLVMRRERIGPVNLVAERELEELEDAQSGSAAEREELGEAIARLRGSIGHLNREGRARLLSAFEDVDTHFRSLFTTLFGGGQAHLELIESDDPLEAGLEIMAQPPGKKLSALTLLSGGEQALTAVALIFAIFLTNPAPICVLDEVDAPLDDANVERFCDLLERMNAETQTRYLIVTHNAVTMSRMDRLYGVTMVERGVSRLVSVDLWAAEELVAAE